MLYVYDCMGMTTYSHCIYEVEMGASLSVLQKCQIFLEKMQQDSSIAFIKQSNAPFIPPLSKPFQGILEEKHQLSQ